MLTSIAITLMSLYGGFISRLHGGGYNISISKAIKNLLWSIPISIATTLAIYLCSDFYKSWVIDYGVYAAIAILSVSFIAIAAINTAGKATGHGGGIDIGHSDEEPGDGRSPEKLEYLILWLHDRIPITVYDSILLSLTGLASVSGSATAFYIIDPKIGLLVAIGGILKPIGYVLGWKLKPKITRNLDEPTEIGEFFSGAIAYAFLFIAFFYVIGKTL